MPGINVFPSTALRRRMKHVADAAVFPVQWWPRNSARDAKSSPESDVSSPAPGPRRAPRYRPPGRYGLHDTARAGAPETAKSLGAQGCRRTNTRVLKAVLNGQLKHEAWRLPPGGLRCRKCRRGAMRCWPGDEAAQDRTPHATRL